MKEAIKDLRKDIVEAFDKNSDDKKDNNVASPIPDRLKKNKKIALVTDDKVEDVEFFYPYYRFQEEGYDVDVFTEKGGAFEGKHGPILMESKPISQAVAADYELIYLPGGKAPEELSKNENVLKFVREFAGSGKFIAAICHGPLILAAAGLIKGKKIAAWPGIKDEIEKAGAVFADEALKEDGQFITARKPGDLHRHLYGVLDCLESGEQE